MGPPADVIARTIFYFTMTRKVILCWITVVISLALHDQAFAASNLTTAASVFRVRNPSHVQCTPLRWKPGWLNRPIFRRYEGSRVLPCEALPYHRLLDDLQRQSLDCGFETAIEPKAFRRGAANSVNGRSHDENSDGHAANLTRQGT